MSVLIKNATFPSGEKKDILVEGNRISKISSGISASADEVIDASSKIALPGLINTHTHAAMSLFKGLGEGEPLERWLDIVRKAEAKATPKQIGAGAMLACLEMIRSGTTCFNDMYFHMDEVANAAIKSGMRAVLGYSMVDMGDEKKRRKELEACERFIKSYHMKANGRITASVPPHSIYSCSRELLLQSLQLSQKYSLIWHIHLSETRKELFDCLSEHGLRPAQYLDSLNALSERTLAAHCVWMSKEEVKLLASRKASVSLNPVSNMKLASGGVAPFPEMHEFGINVSIGTDGSASNNSLSMFEAMKMLSLSVKNARWDASAANASQMLHAATAGGARALGINAGELAEGKLADIILLDGRAPNMVPHRDIMSNIVYSAHAGNVTDSIIDGQIVMRDSQVLTLDSEKVVEAAMKEAERLI